MNKNVKKLIAGALAATIFVGSTVATVQIKSHICPTLSLMNSKNIAKVIQINTLASLLNLFFIYIIPSKSDI